MLGFAFHTPGADVTQGMRAPVTSVPLRHRANHRSGSAGRRFRPIRCYRIEISVMTRDGVRLAVHDGGPRRAEHTVVFLHGFCLTGASWSHQIDYLLRRYGEHVRVISYDHRGHGRSSGAPMSTYRIEQLASDLADVLVALEVSGSVTLVGHSMGGMVALTYLGRPAPDRPVDPQGLVLVATAAGRLAERGLGRLLATPATAALVGLIHHTPEQVLRVLAGPVCATLGRWYGYGRAQRATLVSVAAEALTTTPVSTAAGFLPSLSSYDQYRTLGSVRARTIVISGGADVLTPPAHSRELAAGIAGATHVHLPYAGHMLAQQAPHVINDAIQRATLAAQPTRGFGPEAKHERMVT
jgi:pimeloyl-ACP methyl ester carboxylesterase